MGAKWCPFFCHKRFCELFTYPKDKKTTKMTIYMNYEKIYNDLISTSRDKILDGYSERHHIIPRCMGGTDDSSNIVSLTPEEHFVAHLLLVKIYPHNRSLVYSAMMFHKDTANNKAYGWLRRRRAALGISESHKKLISKALAGKKKSQDHRDAMSRAQKLKWAIKNGNYVAFETPEEVDARWKKYWEDRKKAKDDAVITALIYAVI